MASGTEIAKAYVQIVPSADGIGANIQNAFSGVDALGDNAGASVGASFSDAFGTALKTTAGVVTAVAGEIALLVASLSNAITEVAEYGDNVDKMSQKIGISTDAYQEWAYVMELSGANVDSLQGSMKKLSGVIVDAEGGTASAVEKIEALGLSIDDLNGKSQEEQLSLVISKLQDMESGAERTAIASDLLGKSATELAPLLNMTAEETEALKQQAHDMGMVMSEDAVKSSAEFQDSLTTLNGVMTGARNTMISQFLPAVTQTVNGFSAFMSGDANGLTMMTEGIQTFINNLVELAPQMMELAVTLIEGLGTALIENMPLLIETASQIVLEFSMGIIEYLPELVQVGLDIITNIMLGIAEALPTMIPTIVGVLTEIINILISNMPLILNASLQLIQGLADGFIQALPVLMDALPTIIDNLCTFLIGAIPQILDAGIQLFMGVVNAIPQFIPQLVEMLPTIIQSITNVFQTSIPVIIDATIQLLMAMLDALPDICIALVDALPIIIETIITTLIGNIDLIVQTGFDLLVALVQNMPEIIKKILESIVTLVGEIILKFESYFDQFSSVGDFLVQGVWQGIKDAWSWLIENMENLAQELLDAIVEFFQIFSPSHVMRDDVGQWIAKGLAVGIEEYGDEAVQSALNVSENVLEAFDGIDEDMNEALSNNMLISGNASIDVSANSTTENINNTLMMMQSSINELNARMDNGIEINWDDRQLARLVQTYA